MYEVELKVRADHGDVRTRLDGLGAEPLGAVVQEDTYYDAPHRDFAETDEALRVRRESTKGGGSTEGRESTKGSGSTEGRESMERRESTEAGGSRTFLTYKGPLVDDTSKTREEAETAVADGSAAVDILSNLGFVAAATVRKERERYALEGYTVTLDTVDGLGTYVEVETETEDDLESAREGAFDLLERLGLDPEEGIRTSYLGMLLAGNLERGVTEGGGDAGETGNGPEGDTHE